MLLKQIAAARIIAACHHYFIVRIGKLLFPHTASQVTRAITTIRVFWIFITITNNIRITVRVIYLVHGAPRPSSNGCNQT